MILILKNYILIWLAFFMHLLNFYSFNFYLFLFVQFLFVQSLFTLFLVIQFLFTQFLIFQFLFVQKVFLFSSINIKRKRKNFTFYLFIFFHFNCLIHFCVSQLFSKTKLLQIINFKVFKNKSNRWLKIFHQTINIQRQMNKICLNLL